MSRPTRLLTVIAAVALLGTFALGARALGTGSGGPVEVAGRVETLGARDSADELEQVTYQDGLELLASHLVVDGRLAGDPAPEHLGLWGLARHVLPEDAVRSISQLDVVTDGPGGTLALVHRSARDPRRWILSIDPAEAADVIERTLVHELGHLLTLGHDDLDASAAAARHCEGTALAIGCAREGSLLDLFARRFWSDQVEPASFDPGRFVSRYAATAAHEDLAETFMAWVYGRSASGQLGEKLAWMDAQPELVANRDEVRRRLGLG